MTYVFSNRTDLDLLLYIFITVRLRKTDSTVLTKLDLPDSVGPTSKILAYGTSMFFSSSSVMATPLSGW